MAKDTYYFSHDYEPTADTKIQALLGQYGASGYGLYWRIVEILHSESTHQIQVKKYVIMAIARQMQLEIEFVERFLDDCVFVFELFSRDGEFLFCERVMRNIQKRQDIKDKRKAAGSKGGEANAKQLLEFAKANDKQKVAKERKGKEKKGKEIKEEIDILFGRFWEIFDKKEDRQKCYDKFTNLELSEIEKILQVAPTYVQSKPDRQFRKNPLTWLNGKCWNDEVSAPKPTKQLEESEKDSW